MTDGTAEAVAELTSEQARIAELTGQLEAVNLLLGKANTEVERLQGVERELGGALGESQAQLDEALKGQRQIAEAHSTTQGQLAETSQRLGEVQGQLMSQEGDLNYYRQRAEQVGSLASARINAGNILGQILFAHDGFNAHTAFAFIRSMEGIGSPVQPETVTQMGEMLVKASTAHIRRQVEYFNKQREEDARTESGAEFGFMTLEDLEKSGVLGEEPGLLASIVSSIRRAMKGRPRT